jgi:calcium-dependent protein kinase
MRQILYGVYYLHKHLICHRDLKPANFLLVAQGPIENSILKIADFGLSRNFERGQTLTSTVGSLMYTAPEVFNKSYTEKADMWSLGVIVYSLLTGQSLFSGTDAEATRKIKAGRADWSTAAFEPLSTDAKQFVKALIVADPLQRMSAAEALEHPWLASAREQDSVPIHGGVIPNLLRFASTSSFKRACLISLTWSLKPEDLDNLRKQFLVLEREHQGVITIRRLKQCMGCNNRLADMGSDHALQLLDDDMELSYSELVAAEMHTCLSTNEYALSKMFQRLDPAGNGVSVSQLCERLGHTTDAFDDKDFLGGINAIDSGIIGFEDFCCYLRQPLTVCDNPPDQSSHVRALGFDEPEPEPEFALQRNAEKSY